jgi:hypothetical protein
LIEINACLSRCMTNAVGKELPRARHFDADTGNVSGNVLKEPNMKTLSFFKTGMVAALGATAVGALSFLGWSASAAQQGAASPAFLPLSVSINALMVAMVDDVAHDIWDGGNKPSTLTAGEWQIIDEHSTQLQALATLISLGGTGQADRGWSVSPAWQDWSRKLRDMGVTVKAAADAKNQTALRMAGDALTAVCEGCHDQFKPELPTEGILHKGHGHK